MSEENKLNTVGKYLLGHINKAEFQEYYLESDDDTKNDIISELTLHFFITEMTRENGLGYILLCIFGLILGIYTGAIYL